MCIDDNVEKSEPSCSVDGNASVSVETLWTAVCRDLRKFEKIHHTIQQSYPWGFIRMEIRVSLRPLRSHFQSPRFAAAKLPKPS